MRRYAARVVMTAENTAPTCPSDINAPNRNRSIFRLIRQSKASSFHQPKAVFAKATQPYSADTSARMDSPSHIRGSCHGLSRLDTHSASSAAVMAPQ